MQKKTKKDLIYWALTGPAIVSWTIFCVQTNNDGTIPFKYNFWASVFFSMLVGVMTFSRKRIIRLEEDFLIRERACQRLLQRNADQENEIDKLRRENIDLYNKAYCDTGGKHV